MSCSKRSGSIRISLRRISAGTLLTCTGSATTMRQSRPRSDRWRGRAKRARLSAAWRGLRRARRSASAEDALHTSSRDASGVRFVTTSIGKVTCCGCRNVSTRLGRSMGVAAISLRQRYRRTTRLAAVSRADRRRAAARTYLRTVVAECERVSPAHPARRRPPARDGPHRRGAGTRSRAEAMARQDGARPRTCRSSARACTCGSARPDEALRMRERAVKRLPQSVWMRIITVSPSEEALQATADRCRS